MTKHPVVVDMHFETLLGRGWVAGDPGNDISTTTTAYTSTGWDLPVASSGGFVPGMMLCYLATDGQYYAAGLHSILAGPVFRLDRLLPVPIATGAPVYNFHRDDAHPNTYGGAVVADDALRQIARGRLEVVEARISDLSDWTPVAGAALSAASAIEYRSLGTGTVGQRATAVNGPGIGAGAYSVKRDIPAGDYIASIAINCGIRAGGYSGAVEYRVDITRQDGSTYTAVPPTYVFGFNGNHVISAPFKVATGCKVSVVLLSGQDGAWRFDIGRIEFRRKIGTIEDVNNGKHVLFGDSWFSVGSATAARLTERLDNAQVVTKGIAGNKIDQLISRFASDVTPEQPDYVWVMVGTNDYYAGITPGSFEQQVLQLRQMIQDIGARPIFFTASVGAVTFNPQKLAPSRAYALGVKYHPDTSEVIPPDHHLALTMALADYVIETGDPAQTGGVLSARDAVVANS